MATKNPAKANMPQKAGRPRREGADKNILKAALDLVSAKGFRAITVDQIAAKAGVGKMTIYRRWPNKAAVVMDSLLRYIGPGTDFPDAPTALERLQKQLSLQAAFFRGKHARLIRSLIAEAQADAELAHAFRERWIKPRRAGVFNILQAAVREGELAADTDLEVATDMLYGALYYRLLLGTAAIDSSFVHTAYRQFLSGHKAG